MTGKHRGEAWQLDPERINWSSLTMTTQQSFKGNGGSAAGLTTNSGDSGGALEASCAAAR